MVTTTNGFTFVAPVEPTAVIPAKAPAPGKALVPAKKAAQNAVAKKVVKKPAPIAKAPAKKIAKPVAAKSVKAPAPASATPTVKTGVKPVAKPKAAPVKQKKPKLVRDSFTIPKAEYSALADLKQRAGKLASPAKKSELLRAGIKALATMGDNAFLAALKAVPAIKTGRPNKV